jgi:radical SAM superfamily enzyme YgiQ (UPF0313 family)/GT2 family glycosyltransferase
MKTLVTAIYNYNGQGLDAWHDHGAGMAYCSAKAAGCDVHFLDMKALKNEEELKVKLKGYDLISFGLKSSYYSIGMRVVKIAKEYGSKVMVGGYHATAAPHELIDNPDIDYIFKGESEITFPQFLDWPESFDRVIVGEKPKDLDALPLIDRTIYREPTENCKGWWYGGKLGRMISVLSARGCPYKCKFCQPLEENHFGKVLRRRSVDSLIAELVQLKSLHNPDCVMIHDDTFLLQPSWIEEFIEKYPKVGLPFWAAGRADGICKYPHLVNKLVKVGWELVSVGFESGSQRILDKMGKGTTVEQNIEAGKIIKSAGGKVYANYMLGLPWETRSDIQATAKMADTINAEMPSWAFFTPYPGCEMHDECVKNNWSLLTRDGYDRCPSGHKVRNVDYPYLINVLHGLREEHLDKVCDIIIPTYKNDDLTIACVESIKQCTDPRTYRLIWVDNHSGNTVRVEKSMHGIDYISIKLSKNEGFVGAINKGIKASTSPNICLLNNDTIVTPGWLNKLIRTLNSDKTLGILGALTVDDYLDRQHMDSHHNLKLHSGLVPAEIAYTKGNLVSINKYLEIHYFGQHRPIVFVAFLCAVLKREVVNKIGLLDPNYAMGLYDDNDYNLSVRKAGWKTNIALDTCIYHRGRSTFSLIQKTEKISVDKLLRTNLNYLNKKWGLNLKNAHIKD